MSHLRTLARERSCDEEYSVKAFGRSALRSTRWTGLDARVDKGSGCGS
jgi:hypothetical protein